MTTTTVITDILTTIHRIRELTNRLDHPEQQSNYFLWGIESQRRLHGKLEREYEIMVTAYRELRDQYESFSLAELQQHKNKLLQAIRADFVLPHSDDIFTSHHQQLKLLNAASSSDNIRYSIPSTRIRHHRRSSKLQQLNKINYFIHLRQRNVILPSVDDVTSDPSVLVGISDV